MTEIAHNMQAHWPWFWPLIVFIFGACVGSFLNVCVYRIAAGKSIVRPGSTCACGKPIRFYDNIPILSWFILRGKARCCKRPFSIRYPLVEALTGLLFLLIYWQYPLGAAAALWIFAALLIVGTFIDIDTMQLPDVVTVGGTFLGVALSFALPQLHGVAGSDIFIVNAIRSVTLSVLGIVVGSGVIVWIREGAQFIMRREAMGYGDIVLMGMIGAFCGWQGALFAIFGGSILGAAVMIPLVALRALKKGEGQNAAALRNIEVPFGPWLSLGALLYIVCLRAPVDAYFLNLSELLFP